MAFADGLLPLLRLVSPSLPIGAYAGSEALEYAVHVGWIDDAESTRAWLGGRLRHGLCHLDVPLLARFLSAWQRGDRTSLVRWSRFLRASREGAELLAQDRALCAALCRLLADLGIDEAEWLYDQPDGSYVAAFALAAHHWEIPEEDAAAGYLFAWCETQVSAAVKLVPLGQTQGQRILGDLMSGIAECTAHGLALEDDEVGFSEPGLAIASALHETQYSRLFRS